MNLCVVLLSWVITLTDYAPMDTCPEIRAVPHKWLEDQACEGRSCKVLGWYPGGGEVVYLDDRLDMEDTLHVSIALHEIVHWVQGKQGALLASCESSIEAEREAYAVQRQFLTEYGIYYPAGSVLPMIHCRD